MNSQVRSWKVVDYAKRTRLADPAWRYSDLGRLAVSAARWLTYDQELVALCRQALALGFGELIGEKHDVMCLGYLHGEELAREAWNTFWSK